MRLQTDLDFQQTEIKNLNKKFNVDMFSTSVRGGKPFAAEQKIRESKNKKFRLKTVEKIKNEHKIRQKEILIKATNNLNNTPTVKYGLEPEYIEKSHWNRNHLKLNLILIDLINLRRIMKG